MEKKIRQPQQDRSTEKKNRIIRASYEVFAEVGYYAANTAEIAKRAGVSTGIVYSYFKDKRDILQYVIKIYIDEVSKPLMEIMTIKEDKLDLERLIPLIIDKTIEIHQKNAHLHNALHALESTDNGVNSAFLSLEEHVTKNLSDAFARANMQIENPKEKIHLAMNMIQSFAHESVYDKHDYIDYEAMREIVIKTLLNFFK